MDRQNRSRIVVGAILVLLGMFFLFSQFMNMVFNIRIGQYTWPFIILVPGILLYISAFLTDEKTGQALIIPGSIVSALGMLMFFQNVTGLWASWAYAWAFLFPTSVGIGQIVFGMLRGKNELVRDGWKLARVGLIILVVGFVFFELLIGVSGFGFFGLRGFCFPIVLIIGGLLFIVFNLLPGRKPSETAAPQVIDADASDGQPEEPVTYDPDGSPDQPESEDGPAVE
jgi:hypothetical protein